MLENVYELDLCDCKITDVSMLGNVHELSLCDCKITDVNASYFPVCVRHKITTSFLSDN